MFTSKTWKTACLLAAFAIVPLAQAHADTECDQAVNLVKNGSFEYPYVANAATWDVYMSGDPSIGWQASWRPDDAMTFASTTRPQTALIELQRAGHDSWGAPHEGEQYAELDTDWKGPSSDPMPYPSSIDLYQTIATVPGDSYDLSFAFSARPDDPSMSDNALEARWNGSSLSRIVATSSDRGRTNWQVFSYRVIATSDRTRIDFIDAGQANGIGTLLDDVAVQCVSESSTKEPAVAKSGTLISDVPESFAQARATDPASLRQHAAGVSESATLNMQILASIINMWYKQVSLALS